jgi:hypothetical protein
MQLDFELIGLMFFSRKLEVSSSATQLTSSTIKLFLVVHGPLTEGNIILG